MIGLRVGMLTVTRELFGEEKRRPEGRYWLCRCDCGELTQKSTNQINKYLRNQKRASCGCEFNATRFKKHGKHGTTEYAIWRLMLARCGNPKHKSFAQYGGRGITVCERWRASFSAFYEDMGDRPSMKHSLGRIDNNKGYEPTNCRWETPWQQANNRSTNRILTLGQTSLTIAEWGRKLGISRHVLSGRLRYGWSVERTLTEMSLRPVGEWPACSKGHLRSEWGVRSSTGRITICLSCRAPRKPTGFHPWEELAPRQTGTWGEPTLSKIIRPIV